MDLLSGAPYIAMRSIMSKLVPSDELGSKSTLIKHKNNRRLIFRKNLFVVFRM